MYHYSWDLRECTELRIISLEENRLTKPVLDMRALAKVHTLRLFGNPIEYLPEMHHAFSLRSLSLVGLARLTINVHCRVGLGSNNSPTHHTPRYFAVKTHSIDDSQYVPCNQSDTRE